MHVFCVEALEARAIRISMDGKGRCMDNIFVERLWRSLKYEEVYLNAYSNVRDAWTGIGRWMRYTIWSARTPRNGT